ncbi:MAG: hypothetical protein HOH04_01985 [Rhodospirillaceae bacterium]|nr:hypothetical protein [Rhodospirillaceae bacterium]
MPNTDLKLFDGEARPDEGRINRYCFLDSWIKCANWKTRFLNRRRFFVPSLKLVLDNFESLTVEEIHHQVSPALLSLGLPEERISREQLDRSRYGEPIPFNKAVGISAALCQTMWRRQDSRFKLESSIIAAVFYLQHLRLALESFCEVIKPGSFSTLEEVVGNSDISDELLAEARNHVAVRTIEKATGIKAEVIAEVVAGRLVTFRTAYSICTAIRDCDENSPYHGCRIDRLIDFQPDPRKRKAPPSVLRETVSDASPHPNNPYAGLVRETGINPSQIN